MVFRFLQSRCQTAGGNLTLSDLEEARSQFLSRFPNAFDFFDKVNHSCMEASASAAPDAFGRESMLASLLFVCGQKAARRAFEMQVARFGDQWLNQFFSGVAQWVRQRVPTADDRLMKLYAATAVRVGGRLSIADLIRQDAVRTVVRECLAPLSGTATSPDLAGPLSDEVSVHIATARGIPKPDISKVTEQQVRNFLTWLSPQAQLVLSGANAG